MTNKVEVKQSAKPVTENNTKITIEKDGEEVTLELKDKKTKAKEESTAPKKMLLTETRPV